MATTFLVAFLFIVLSTSLVVPGATYTDKNHRHKHNAYFSTIRKGTGIFRACGYYLRVPVRLELSFGMVFINHVFPAAHGRYVVTRPTSLLVPGHDPPQDITIFMDVSLNPGPDLTGSQMLLHRFLNRRNSHTNSLLSPIKYSRNFLLSLRLRTRAPCPQVLGELKLHGVLKYRGRKSGRKTRGFYSSIFSKTTQRDYANSGHQQAPLLHRGVNLC